VAEEAKFENLLNFHTCWRQLEKKEKRKREKKREKEREREGEKKREKKGRIFESFDSNSFRCDHNRGRSRISIESHVL
jgi:hypothetical protein